MNKKKPALLLLAVVLLSGFALGSETASSARSTSMFQAGAASAQATSGLRPSPPSPQTAPAGSVGYDIVYVRAPRFGDTKSSQWPEVFSPTRLDAGADLMLLHPDGNEEVLVAGGPGSVTDPAISFDAKWVYYAYFPNLQPDRLNAQRGPNLPSDGADIWKINLQTREKVRLTHQEFTPNTGVGPWSGPGDRYPWPAANTALGYGIFNLGPTPVSGGKIAFVSNRNAFQPTKGYTTVTLQLYVMDEDGANVTAIAPMTLGSALHPLQLTDGRIMFSSEEGQGLRDGKLWGIWSIFPDGRQWGPLVSAFHRGQSVHFSTQLSGGDLVTVDYYNLNNSGFGALLRWPVVVPPGVPGFGSPKEADNPRILATCLTACAGSWSMPFTPYGMRSITPFTHGFDESAPVGRDGVTRVGKFTHPSAAPANDLLVVWSPGPVTTQNRPTNLPAIDGGIYVIPGGNPVASPANLVVVKNDPKYQEMWPRAVVPYQMLYGVPQPTQLAWLPNDGTAHPSLPAGTPYGLVGTASLYKRDSAPGWASDLGKAFGGLDPFNSPGEQSSNFIWQGADVGKYTNADIDGIRILTMEPTSHLSYGPHMGKHFYNGANERIRILGEIPVRKAAGVLDPDGNPDTSFIVKIPADVPYTFQLIDKNGMNLAISKTWHQVRPGEVRADCGGCHGHSQLATDFAKTRAGQPDFVPVDLTKTPVMDAEYLRDVRPIFEAKCVSCHNVTQNAGQLNLADRELRKIDPFDYTLPAFLSTNMWPGDYIRIARDMPAAFGRKPMINQWMQGSRYVRPFQARRSLLTWVLYGTRLDGWTNADFPTETVPGERSTFPAGAWDRTADLDYTPTLHAAHTQVRAALTDAEKLTIVRWIELGAPLDLGAFNGHPKHGWFADETRPTLAVSSPRPNANRGPFSEIRIGLADSYSGLNTQSLSVTADVPLGGRRRGEELAKMGSFVGDGIFSIKLTPPITKLSPSRVTVKVRDKHGNLTEQTVRFWVVDATDSVRRE